jgi:hypothetical protein
MIAHQRGFPRGPLEDRVTKHYTQLQKDPRTKHPGVFCFPQGKMTETDIRKRIKEAEFTRQHTISPDQFKQLIKDKMDRAKQYNEARCKKVETRSTQHT